MRQRLFYSFLVFLSALLVVSPVFAARSREEITKNAENGIIFYDSEGGLFDCNTVNFTSKPGGDQITWIGDSYSVDARGKIQDKLPGVDFGNMPSNVQAGKSFAFDIDGGDRLFDWGNIDVTNPAGLTIAKNLKENGSLREFVVFPLGTNDRDYSTEEFGGFIDSLISIVGDEHTVILMTPRTLDYAFDAAVNAVRQSALRHSNILVADWERAVQDNLRGYFSAADPMHPNDEGYDLFVETIYDALPGGAVATLPGKNNAEKVWNYFATANIPGVSNNPAVIAGIIGNLQAESSPNINPFAFNGSHYGIFQTDNADMRQAMTDAGIDHGQYWGTTNAPQDVNDLALQIQLEFLMNDFGHTPGFLNNLDWVTSTGGEQGAASYAELFLVTVERAVNGSDPLQDRRVQDFVNTRLYPNSPQYQNRGYQGTEKRRAFAAEAFRSFTGISATISAGAVQSSGVAQWNDGWLVDNSIPGIIREDRGTIAEVPADAYNTSDGKPNKILLHNTEGSSNGINAYTQSNGDRFPAHFIIDLKKKQGFQHFSINKPSVAIAGGDRAGPIQIEIVGFKGKPGHEYNLQDFSANDWDYLAVVLAAIAEQTGIPLTTNVDWANPTRLSMDEFREYRGILGHMHAPPPNDHSDPGDIWPMVSEAIARNPNASSFATGNIGRLNCDISSFAGLISGGMTKPQADAFMQIYKDITPREWGVGGTLGTEWSIAATTTCTTDLENCVAFTQYFINRYVRPNDHIKGLTNGRGVVSQLISGFGFTNGGTEPRPYAIFSVASGQTMCGGAPCGHTGVVLGVDRERGKIIIGEAGCSSSLEWTGAHEYDLVQYTSGAYTYAYTDGLIQGL